MMKEALELIQSTLDATLAAKKIRSFWNNRTETEDANKREYIVYSYSGGDVPDSADDHDLVKNCSVTIKYYYEKTLTASKSGRTSILDTISLIKSSLESHDIDVSEPFDAGDINSNGFYAVIFECEIWSVV